MRKIFFHCAFIGYAYYRWTIYCKLHIRTLGLPTSGWELEHSTDCCQFSMSILQIASPWSHSVFTITLGENVLYPHSTQEETVGLRDSPKVTQIDSVEPECKPGSRSYSRPQAPNHKCLLTTVITTWPTFKHWEHTQIRCRRCPDIQAFTYNVAQHMIRQVLVFLSPFSCSAFNWDRCLQRHQRLFLQTGRVWFRIQKWLLLKSEKLPDVGSEFKNMPIINKNKS